MSPGRTRGLFCQLEWLTGCPAAQGAVSHSKEMRDNLAGCGEDKWTNLASHPLLAKMRAMAHGLFDFCGKRCGPPAGRPGHALLVNSSFFMCAAALW